METIGGTQLGMAIQTARFSGINMKKAALKVYELWLYRKVELLLLTEKFGQLQAWTPYQSSPQI